MSEAKPYAFVIVRSDGSQEVVLAPLTDNHDMDEGDVAWPLYAAEDFAAVTAERDALREWFEFLADTKASFANGFFDGQLRWWLEWGAHQPVLQQDTYATPEAALKAALDAAKGGYRE